MGPSTHKGFSQYSPQVLQVWPVPQVALPEALGNEAGCLAEQELNNCLLQLIRAEGDDKELAHRFETLVSFLKSPESKRLRDEAERYLAEGKQVSVKINLEMGQPKYELKVN